MNHSRIIEPVNTRRTHERIGFGFLLAPTRSPETTKPRTCRGFVLKPGAGNETRTRDPDLGKVVLYQLSYSRIAAAHSNT
jgi:hypothetical protein